MGTVRTRMAPSPTGYFHLGNISRFLINYALARKNNGQFIWRNEDTDQDRFVPGALEYNMKWAREYGMDWDEGPDKGGPFAPYNQTERLEIYKKAYEKLIEKDYAYKCFCTKERLDEMRKLQEETKQQTRYDGRCRNLSKEEIETNLKNNVHFTVRIKMPKDRRIEFTDAITHTHSSWNSNDVDDYILVKSNGIPTYHLAAVVDDVEMKISHVFRGNEWVATTPVHIMVYEGLEIKPEDRPLIGHFTVILDPNKPGKKFSKRDSSFRVNGLLQKGYLKEAVLNYLMLLGWAPKDNRELFTLEEFVDAFDLNGMQKSNPTWDYKKMDWFNGMHLRKLTKDEYHQKFIEWLGKYLMSATEDELKNNFITEQFSEEKLNNAINFAKILLGEDQKKLKEILELVQERSINFWDSLLQIEFFYKKPNQIDWNIKQLKNVSEKLDVIKKDIYDLFENFPNDTSLWTHEAWEANMRAIGDKYSVKHGDVFMVLRVAVTGGPFSPPLFESLQIIGREEILKRLETKI
jgi:glutamyl-tRNA synthetase